MEQATTETPTTGAQDAIVEGLVAFDLAFLILVSILCASLAAAGVQAALTQLFGLIWPGVELDKVATLLAALIVGFSVLGIAFGTDTPAPWVHWGVASAFGLASHKTGPLVLDALMWLRSKLGMGGSE